MVQGIIYLLQIIMPTSLRFCRNNFSFDLWKYLLWSQKETLYNDTWVYCWKNTETKLSRKKLQYSEQICYAYVKMKLAVSWNEVQVLHKRMKFAKKLEVNKSAYSLQLKY